jgi:formimidoylglutamate deiminase
MRESLSITYDCKRWSATCCLVRRWPERLFDCATVNGAASIGLQGGGRIEAGAPADFFTVDLDDLSIAGSATEDLLANIVFSLARTAVRDVVVAGRRIVENGRHG